MSYHQYSPIPQRDAPSPVLEVKHKVEPDSRKDRLLRWATIIIVLCSTIDAFAIVYIVALPYLRQQATTQPAFEDIPFRSTYFKLDTLYSGTLNATARDPIVNLPRVLAHVDSSTPSTVLPSWPERWVTPGGMVPFNERKVLVTPHVSTVADFHVLDFGMEKCSLTLQIPSSDNGVVSDDITLDAWLLSSSQSVDSDSISWDSKPKRERHVGIFTPGAGGIQQLTPFACKAASYQIFELSCRTGNCNVNIAATMKEEFGLYIQQYQTI